MTETMQNESIPTELLFNTSTSTNHTETNYTDPDLVSRDINMYIIFGPIIMMISTATLVLHVMLLAVLKRCRRLPLQIRWLSFNFVITDILLLFIIIMLTGTLITIDMAYFDVLYYTRIMLVSSLYAVSSSTTVGFAMERLITLTRPFHYQTYLCQRNCAIFIVLVWLVNFVIPISIFALRATSECQWRFEFCSLSLIFDLHRVMYTILLCMNSIIIVCSFIKILLIVKNQIKKIHAATSVTQTSKNNEFQLTRVIARLIMAYALFHMPILVYCIIFVLKPELQVPKVQLAFQTLSFVCAILNSYISLYLYIWKIPESRLNFLLLFCSCSKKYKEQSEELKLRVFNINSTTNIN